MSFKTRKSRGTAESLSEVLWRIVMKLPEFNLFCDKLNLPEFSWYFPAFTRISRCFPNFFLRGESSPLPPISHAYVYDHQRKKAITLGSDGVCFPKLENSLPPTFNILASAGGGQKPTIFKKLEGSASTCKDFSLQQGNIGPCKEFTRKSNAQGNGKEKCKN